jgi:hypothetical protein
VHRAVQFGIGDRWGCLDRYRLRDLILDRKDVYEVTVVTLGPDMIAGLCLDKLGGDTDAVTGLAQAAAMLLERSTALSAASRLKTSSPRPDKSKRTGSQWTLRWREMDSNFRFLVVRPSNRQTVMGDGTAVSKTGADLLGNRRFESISLQGRVCEPSVPESPRLRSPAAGAGRTVRRLPVRPPARRCRVLPAIGAAFPEAANNRVKLLRQMFIWACSPEWLRQTMNRLAAIACCSVLRR